MKVKNLKTKNAGNIPAFFRHARRVLKVLRDP